MFPWNYRPTRGTVRILDLSSSSEKIHRLVNTVPQPLESVACRRKVVFRFVRNRMFRSCIVRNSSRPSQSTLRVTNAECNTVLALCDRSDRHLVYFVLTSCWLYARVEEPIRGVSGDAFVSTGPTHLYQSITRLKCVSAFPFSLCCLRRWPVQCPLLLWHPSALSLSP